MPGIASEYDSDVQYRVTDREAYHVYRADEDGEWRLIDRKVHDLGYVPYVEYAINPRFDRLGDRVFDPFAPSLVDIDRNIYNKFSLLDEIDRNQTFSQMFIPGQAMSGLDLGLYSAISFDATAGSPLYLSPDAQMAAGLWSRIKEEVQLARTMFSVSRGLAEVSKEARATSTIHFESDEKYSKYASVSIAAEKWETRLLAVLADASNEEPIEVEYPKQFDVMALESKIDNLLKLVDRQVDEKVLAPMAASVVSELMKRGGVKKEDIDKARDEILSGKFISDMPSMPQGNGLDTEG